jgi:hypothetical protein
MFTLNQLDRLMDPAMEMVLKDRAKFNKIYEIVEGYIQKRNLIVGGDPSIKKVLGLPRDYDDYNYEIYSEHPAKDAFEITNKIADHTQAVYMRTDIYGKELTIQIQGRQLVKIIGLDKNARAIIQPLSVDGILYIPPDYHLLYMYRQLYTPLPDFWEPALKYEDQLQNWLRQEYSSTPDKFVGGAASLNRQELKSQLLKYMAKREDIVLVGPDAADILLDVDMDLSTQLYVLGFSSLKKEMVEWIHHRTKLPTFEKTSNVQLLNDFRLNRSTIYVKLDTANIPVLYIYDSLEYDLVPFNLVSSGPFEGGRIGNLFVLMRFALIDIWLIKVIRTHGGIDAEFAKNRIIEAYQLYFALRDSLPTSKTGIDPEKICVKDKYDTLSVFQPPESDYYAGQYRSDQAARREIIKSQDLIPDYYPIKFKAQNGDYKTL